MDQPISFEHRGCSLSYRVRGDGRPVLMIQGVGVQGDGWQPQVEVLSGRYRCLTFDNRGLGRSQPVGHPLSIELMAQDALALMKAQGWDSAHVVGHSMGGLIAQQIALSDRQRVRSLALLCTFSRGRDATQLTPWMLWVGLRTRVGTRRQRRHSFLRMVMSPKSFATSDLDAVAERFAPLFGHDLADQPSISLRQLRAMNAYDASPRLAELSGLPTLVLTAAHDRIARPELGRRLAKGIPGSRLVELAGAAHGVTIEYPELINDFLLEHLTAADALCG